MRKPGEFTKTKALAKSRQRYFDTIVAAEKATREGRSVELIVDEIPVRTSPEETNMAILRIRDGYRLVWFTAKDDALTRWGQYIEGSFALNHVVCWCVEVTQGEFHTKPHTKMSNVRHAAKQASANRRRTSGRTSPVRSSADPI